jgi:transcriptional regulator
MFVPPRYKPQDPRWRRAIVREFPLALLVSVGGGGLLATHLPVIPADGSFDTGLGETGLVGVTLAGHMDRQNPHWKASADHAPGLLVFFGPHAYVSPGISQERPAAPTWNYASVHLHGTPEPIESREEALDVVKATVITYERDHGTQWDMKGSLSYFGEIVAGLGAFRFKVTSAEAMFKLSQEKPATTRSLVMDTLAASGPANARQLPA